MIRIHQTKWGIILNISNIFHPNYFVRIRDGGGDIFVAQIIFQYFSPKSLKTLNSKESLLVKDFFLLLDAENLMKHNEHLWQKKWERNNK